MTALVFVAEITVFDPALLGTRILRYASQGFATGSADTPPHTYYAERITQPALITRDMFSAGATQGASRVGYGDLVLANEDGQLDGLQEYGFDGREIIIRQGVLGTAYPAAFTTVLAATMQQPELDFGTVTIKLRDRQQEMNVPLQANKYLGDNVLPAGVEGLATDLKGKPKPLCYGVVKNVTPPQVNTSKLIYQIHDGPLASIDDVRDRGVSLGQKRYVIVGGGPNLASSEDGGIWTLRASGFVAANIYGIAFGNGVFVAVGGTGQLSMSLDGITWNRQVTPMGAHTLIGVAYGAGRFVAVTNDGLAMTSTDGVRWDLIPGFVATTPGGIVYRNGVFIVPKSNGIVYSFDGLLWVTVAVTGIFFGVTYGAGLYVLVGNDLTGVPAIATSPDLTAWTLRVVPATHTDVEYRAVAFNGGVFVAVGFGGGNIARIATSTNGTAWTSRVSAVTAGLHTVTIGNGVFLAGGLHDGTGDVETSIDGIAWTRFASGFTFLNTVEGAAYGNNVGVNNYASMTDLLDDTQAPEVGRWKAYLDGGYFRLGANPIGQVTSDATEGATAADRTTAQIFTRLLTTPLAAPLLEWSQADIAALDALNAAVLGLWIGTEEVTVESVVNLVAGSPWAWWGVDRLGVFRLARFATPAGVPALALTANEIIGNLERIKVTDQDAGIPAFKSVVRWGKNYTVQTDLAAGVPADRRTFLAKEWREATATDLTVQTAHLLAPQVSDDSLLTTEADAQAEATRRQTIRGVRRDRLEAVTELNAASVAVDLGAVVSVAHARFGLSAGKLFTVLGLEPNAAERQLRITLWG